MTNENPNTTDMENLLNEDYNETMNVKADTTSNEFKIIDDEKNTPTLEEAQAFVGGYVECITWPNGDLLIVMVGLVDNGNIFVVNDVMMILRTNIFKIS